MTRIIQFAVTTLLILTLAACGGDDNSALRDQIAMLEMERDEATTAKMTAESRIANLQAEVEQLKSEITMLMDRPDISAADLAALRSEAETLRGQLAGRADISPEDLAALQAEVETLRADVTRLMVRADISPEDLAALQAEVARLTDERTAAEMERQARLDAQTMASVGHGGLARSPHPPVYAVGSQDTLANLQPGSEAVFSPLSSMVRRTLGALFPSDGAAYVKSVSSDGEGGFNVTWVIDGAESPVHFPADAYNPESFGFEHVDEARVHYLLFGWTDALYPELFPGTTEDRTDGSTQFDYLDLQGWDLYFGQDHTGISGSVTYGVRTLPDNLPIGNVIWQGSMYASRWDDYGAVVLNLNGAVKLEANLDDMTISGRIDGIHIPSWASASGQNEPLEGSYIDIESGAIHDAEFTQEWVGHGPMDAASGETMLGFRGAMTGEFYGPAAEEVGGVLSGQRHSTNDSPGQYLVGGFGAAQAE